MGTRSLAKAAVWYAKAGWKVFPVHSIKDSACTCGNKDCSNQGKHPLTPHGVLDATTDLAQIQEWWKRWPWANVGIATGRESGIIVLDVDPRHGGDETLRELEREHGELPETPMVLTGGGGLHYYFKHPGGKVGNAIGFADGLDLRGDGGYVLAPISAHLSGRTYEWEATTPPNSVKPATLPGWLASKIRPAQKGTSGKQRGGIDPALVLRGVLEGQRHDKLYRYACRLRTQNVVSKSEAAVLVGEAAAHCKPPYADEDPDALVNDVWERYPPGSKKIQELVEEEITAPIVTTDDRMVKVEWVSRQVTAIAKSLKEHSDGRISGHLSISTTLPGVPKSLRSAQFSFTALRSRTELANDLARKVPNDEVPWDRLIEFLCKVVTEHVQQGEAVQVLTAGETPAPVDWILWPVLMKGHPTIIFGQEGTGKSYLATLLCYLAVSETPVTEKLGFRADRVLPSMLYLDWEGSADVLQDRITRLAAGLLLPPVPILYRHCSRPLYSDVEAIKAGAPNRPDLLVVDSLIPACGGNPLDAQAAGELFSAVRSFDCTALLIGHTPKHAAGTSRASVYGSGVFQFLARSIFEVRTDQEENEDRIRIGLVHKKMNYGKRERPIGLEFCFLPDMTTVQPTDPSGLPSLESAQALSWRVVHHLRESNTAQSPKQIAEALDVEQGKIRAMLSYLRGKDEPEVVRLDRGKWGALAHGGGD